MGKHWSHASQPQMAWPQPQVDPSQCWLKFGSGSQTNQSSKVKCLMQLAKFNNIVIGVLSIVSRSCWIWRSLMENDTHTLTVAPVGPTTSWSGHKWEELGTGQIGVESGVSWQGICLPPRWGNKFASARSGGFCVRRLERGQIWGETFFWVLWPLSGFMHKAMIAWIYGNSDHFPNLLLKRSNHRMVRDLAWVF
jgi:hypothetical protein